MVYDELKLIARAQLRRRSRGTLMTTEVVHEAYLKLFGNQAARAKDRSHFLALAAQAMRQVLVDAFRSRQAEKRGGGLAPETLDTGSVPVEDRGAVLLAIHQALDRLAGFDERMAQVVVCKFFGGMTEDEIANALGVSKRTVSSEWRQARAWLARELAA